MELERKLLKELYNRSFAVGLEYAEINGFKYTYESKYSVLVGIEPFVLESNKKVYVPNCFDRINFDYSETNEYNNFCSNVKLYFGPSLKYIYSHSFKHACWVDEIYLPCVRKIGSFCFNDSTIRKVIAPNLVALGSNCFAESEIETIYCPNLVSLGRNCFFDCTKLVEINTKKVVKAGHDCFSHCKSLKRLDLRNLVHLSSNLFFETKIKELRLDNISSYSDSFKSLNYNHPLDLKINLYYDTNKILKLFNKLKNVYIYYDNVEELEQFKMGLKPHTYNINYIKKEKK